MLKKVKSKQVEPRICPICDMPLLMNFAITDCFGKDTIWYLCKCGCFVNGEKQVNKNFYTSLYKDVYNSLKQVKERVAYFMDRYINLIEEMTYGRKFLDVGFTETYYMDYMEDRGWLVDGIDLIDNKYITGDFETHDFKHKRYDCIYMGQVLECFDKPIEALKKAYGLLRQEGVLLISTPNADAAFHSGIKYFGHWNGDGCLVFFSQRKLIDILEKIGYNIVVKYEHFGQRTLNWNVTHIVARRDKEEDIYIPEVKDGEVDEHDDTEQVANESERTGSVESNGTVGSEPNGLEQHK